MQYDWKKIIGNQEESTLSVKEYGKQNNISFSFFSNSKRRLKDDKHENGLFVPVKVVHYTHSHISAKKVGFLFLDKNGVSRVAGHWEEYVTHMVGKYNRMHKVQLVRITPHLYRYTYCTNMARAVMNPKSLQYLKRHAEEEKVGNVMVVS